VVALAQETGASVAKSAGDIIADKSIDAVLICTPTDTHADLIEQAAKAGKAVFCEKPVDLSADRVRACLKVVADTKAPLMIGFNRRFDPGHAALRAALQALTADSNTELWAMGDVFGDKLDTSEKSLGAQFKEQPGRVNVGDRKFTGLDSYQKVIASGADVILLAAPGGFRPLHLRAAVDAGKHVFVEKPMGVCPTGVRSVRESVAVAKQKKLALRQGFAMRYDAPYREAMKRVHDGQIGDIVAIYSTRMSNRLSRFDARASRSGTISNGSCASGTCSSGSSGDWIMGGERSQRGQDSLGDEGRAAGEMPRERRTLAAGHRQRVGPVRRDLHLGERRVRRAQDALHGQVPQPA
ncbi:MAG: Gfo/Idh/MocA family oxidoreductase, partial [Verrucomicrobiae bacterium]|nr:Gfo/Idh/MocA family oxidoreductase [Verrucomicrobiae bacterium]